MSTVSDIKKKLKVLGISTSGAKGELLERLASHLNSMKMPELRLLRPKGVIVAKLKADLIKQLLEVEEFTRDGSPPASSIPSSSSASSVVSITTITTISSGSSVVSISSTSSTPSPTPYSSSSAVSTDKPVNPLTGINIEKKLECLGLPTSGSRAEILDRLTRHLNSMKVSGLHSLCPEKMPQSTKKDDLIRGLLECQGFYFADEPPSPFASGINIEKKLCTLGFSVSGSKSELLERLVNCLSSRNMAELRLLRPEGMVIAKTKTDLIKELLVVEGFTQRSDRALSVASSDKPANPLTVDSLKKKLRILDLSTSGVKAELLERLTHHLKSMKMPDLRLLAPEGMVCAKTKAELTQQLLECKEFATYEIHQTPLPISNYNDNASVMSYQGILAEMTSESSDDEEESPQSFPDLSFVPPETPISTLRSHLADAKLETSGTKKELRLRLLAHLSNQEIPRLRNICGITGAGVASDAHLLTVANMGIKLKELRLHSKGVKEELRGRLLFHYSQMDPRELVKLHHSGQDDLLKWIISLDDKSLHLIRNSSVSSVSSSASSKKTNYPPSIPKNVRLDVWNRWIGKEKGCANCPLCLAVEIQQGKSGWHASHVISHSNGGSAEVSNLRPLCSGCNLAMTTHHMLDYCKNFYPSAIQRLNLS